MTRKYKRNNKKRRTMKRQKQKGGQIRLNWNDIPLLPTGYGLNVARNRPYWRGSRNRQLSTIVGIRLSNGRRLNVYGSSLPDLTMRDRVTNTLALYMYRYKINRLISFQDCANHGDEPNHVSSCGGKTNLEDATWFALKFRDIRTGANPNAMDPNITFQNIYINDMTAGTCDAWYRILNLAVDATDNDKRTLMHCLAGFGRTGSALLAMLCKYYFLHMTDTSYYNAFNPRVISNYGLQNTAANENYKFMGYGTSYHMYTRLKQWFQDSLGLVDEENLANVPNQMGTQEFGDTIRRFNVDNIVNEVFNISTFSLATLFVARINFIILYTMLVCGYFNSGPKQIELYSVVLNPSNFNNPNYIFVPSPEEMDESIFRSFGTPITSAFGPPRTSTMAISPPPGLQIPANAPSYANARQSSPIYIHPLSRSISSNMNFQPVPSGSVRLDSNLPSQPNSAINAAVPAPAFQFNSSPPQAAVPVSSHSATHMPFQFDIT